MLRGISEGSTGRLNTHAVRQLIVSCILCHLCGLCDAFHGVRHYSHNSRFV